MVDVTLPEGWDIVTSQTVKNRPEDRSALSGKVPDELLQRRRTDSQPGQPVPFCSMLARGLLELHKIYKFEPRYMTALRLAAEKLERDEQNNAEMIDVLVRAGYRDIPAEINAEVIKRLLGYITPGA